MAEKIVFKIAGGAFATINYVSLRSLVRSHYSKDTRNKRIGLRLIK